MKRSHGDDIEDLEATEPAVRRRPHQPSGSTNPLAAPVDSISPLASAMVALELAEASTGQMFGEHRNIQTTLELPARFVCSDSERTGKGHRPVQRRSEILITIEGRREIMTHPVDSAEAIARFDYQPTINGHPMIHGTTGHGILTILGRTTAGHGIHLTGMFAMRRKRRKYRVGRRTLLKT